MGQIGIWQAVIIVIVTVLVFGRGKISELMSDLAKGVSSFKKGLKEEASTPPPAERIRNAFEAANAKYAIYSTGVENTSMRVRLWGAGNLPKPSDPKKRIVTFATLFAFISVSLFIVTELAIVVAATIWAVAELLDFPHALTVALSVLLGAPTIWAAIAVVILAFNAETDPENNKDIVSGETIFDSAGEPGPVQAAIAH